MIFSYISDDKNLMQPWPQDFSACGLEELLRFQSENRDWSKELRRKTNALVDSRLARKLSLADYLASRQLIRVDDAECRMRAGVLGAHIDRHLAAR